MRKFFQGTYFSELFITNRELQISLNVTFIKRPLNVT